MTKQAQPTKAAQSILRPGWRPLFLIPICAVTAIFGWLAARPPNRNQMEKKANPAISNNTPLPKNSPAEAVVSETRTNIVKTRASPKLVKAKIRLRAVAPKLRLESLLAPNPPAISAGTGTFPSCRTVQPIENRTTIRAIRYPKNQT